MLQASRLTRRFGDRLAVDDVSFEVGKGEIFALLGPNGAGKTTTLRMLAGLIAPTSGTVCVDGRVGFLTEAPGLWDRLTVHRNLFVHARLQGVTDPAGAVRDALARFDLTSRANELAAQLSKGLKQRVALARALLHQPSAVLLDEPTSGLDPESARSVRDLILRLRADGRAIVVSTHNLDEVERVADRVAVLKTTMVAIDTPTALRRRVFGQRLRIVLSGAVDGFAARISGPGITDVNVCGSTISVEVDDAATRAPGIVTMLVDAGAQIQTVAPEQRSLEEVYLRLLS